MPLLRELFSLVFGKVDSTSPPKPKAKMVFLISVSDPAKLDLYQENLRSNAVEFEVREGTSLFVPEDELETARAILEEGQWEY